jgi:hypothetical protein
MPQAYKIKLAAVRQKHFLAAAAAAAQITALERSACCIVQQSN